MFKASGTANDRRHGDGDKGVCNTYIMPLQIHTQLCRLYISCINY